MELRFRTARTTKDLDFTVRRHPPKPATPSSPFYRMPEQSTPETIFHFAFTKPPWTLTERRTEGRGIR